MSRARALAALAALALACVMLAAPAPRADTFRTWAPGPALAVASESVAGEWTYRDSADISRARVYEIHPEILARIQVSRDPVALSDDWY